MKRKTLYAAIIVVVVVLLAAGGGGYWWWQARQPQPTPTPSPEPPSSPSEITYRVVLEQPVPNAGVAAFTVVLHGGSVPALTILERYLAGKSGGGADLYVVMVFGEKFLALREAGPLKRPEDIRAELRQRLLPWQQAVFIAQYHGYRIYQLDKKD